MLLIENLQREDLSPVEEALGYKALIDEHGFSQEEVAKSVGKSRPAVANALRLLKLPDNINGISQRRQNLGRSCKSIAYA